MYNPTDIEKFAAEGNKIGLVKAYREMFGSSLLEAKKAIETVAGFPYEDPRQKDIKGMVELFFGKTLINAIQLLIDNDNYKKLGFKSLSDAVKAIENNF